MDFVYNLGKEVFGGAIGGAINGAVDGVKRLYRGDTATPPSQPNQLPTPPTPAQPPKLLKDVPWRKYDPDIWTSEYHEKLLSKLRNRSRRGNAKRRAIILGPTSSGKSAFVNSVLSIGIEQDTVRETAKSGKAVSSYTNKLGEYQPDRTGLQTFILCDTMGLEPGDYKGFNVNDIEPLLKGHVLPGYSFSSTNPITSGNKYYKAKPEKSDKVHVVVFCVQALLVKNHSTIHEEILRKIDRLQSIIKQTDIPSIVLVTHVDEVCPEVSKDITNIFHSIAVEEAVTGAKEVFTIAPSYIHPIENYHRSPVTDRKTDIPLLLALQHILNLADDYVESTRNKSRCVLM